MIAHESISASQPAASSLPVAMEQTVCCHADIGFAVASIMSAMGKFPFAPTDGFAVQLAATEGLTQFLEHVQRDDPKGDIRVRTHVTSRYVRIQIETASSGSSQPAAISERFGSIADSGLQLMRTYMTSVEFRRQGRQVILYRARGQGSAVSGPPIGYDFQI
ncbi:ATP-binding protein [Planctomicrobium sp. SH661]|uniref:ATP-binding protein n=1 Tax=Planctomicrobium sp. SH661 TaxID=3448124 RepID=UPI003F5CB348